MGRRRTTDPRLALVAGCLIVAASSFGPWFSRSTFAGRGELGGLGHGGAITLFCGVIGAALAIVLPRLAGAAMAVALAWALACAYEMPGTLAASQGGEVNVAWGAIVLIVAAALSVGAALLVSRRD